MSTIPGTFAQAPPLPATSPYGIYELYEYQIFTRASWKAATGQEAPPFNPALPVKNWAALDVDDTDVSVFFTLKTVAQPGGTSQIVLPAKIVPFMTQAGQASTLNLPDEATSYPPYVVAPTTAYEQDGALELPINAEYLSTMAEAKELGLQLGMTGTVPEITEWQPTSGPGGLAIVYPSTESRRWYQFTDGLGQVQTVGVLLRAMNANGVGAPGKWFNDGKSWQWLPMPVGPPPIPTGPVFPQPMRRLLPTETLQSVSMGMAVMIFNSALPSA